MPIREGLDSDPHAIPLFQTCNDAAQKVSTFVLVAMSVKARALDPTTELNIHTAFSSAIAGELRRSPPIRVIDRIESHWRYLNLSNNAAEEPTRTGNVPVPHFTGLGASSGSEPPEPEFCL